MAHRIVGLLLVLQLCPPPPLLARATPQPFIIVGQLDLQLEDMKQLALGRIKLSILPIDSKGIIWMHDIETHNLDH